jgi:hypothetical protein
VPLLFPLPVLILLAHAAPFVSAAAAGRGMVS